MTGVIIAGQARAGANFVPSWHQTQLPLTILVGVTQPHTPSQSSLTQLSLLEMDKKLDFCYFFIYFCKNLYFRLKASSWALK